MPNIENLTILKKFFDDGAPHYHLDMNIPFGESSDPEIIHYAKDPIPQTCGSAGCIAGAAYMLLHPSPDRQIPLEFQWQVIGSTALDLLDLPHSADDEFYYHDLFNPHLAPDRCTAEDASKAIQNVIDGKAPW